MSGQTSVIGERGKLWINDQTLLSNAGNFTVRFFLKKSLVLFCLYHIRPVVEKWSVKVERLERLERLSEEQPGSRNILKRT